MQQRPACCFAKLHESVPAAFNACSQAHQGAAMEHQHEHAQLLKALGCMVFECMKKMNARAFRSFHVLTAVFLERLSDCASEHGQSSPLAYWLRCRPKSVPQLCTYMSFALPQLGCSPNPMPTVEASHRTLSNSSHWTRIHSGPPRYL